MITSSFTKRICITACCLSFVMPAMSFAASSTDIHAANVVPAQHEVKLRKCSKTKEQLYNVTMVGRTSAYPACPAGMVIDKVNLRTEGVVDVDTYVSLDCCEPDVGWKNSA
jgi:hypothetical protein